MTVQEVIDLAKNAELKQLSVKSDSDAITGFINLGVLELYKRFPLEEAEAIITLRDGKTSYKLDGTDTDVDIEVNKELMMISAIYNEVGDQISLNDEDDLLGANTPSYNTIEIPAVTEGGRIGVIYRVSPKFVSGVTDTVNIPPQLLEALLNYIGYRGHGAVNGSLKTENNSHYMRFDNSCNRAIRDGLVTTDDMAIKKFKDRGFV